jgi:tRNA A-37 threonylcarbamoyl transferase component Bud32
LALIPGTRLGGYEVTAQIGEGGMGQVYRATDTKLKRQVALKILPPSVAADHDRLARFQREAEVLASLNHPNIAGIYGLEEGGGATALVMELVEGEDLSTLIARGQPEAESGSSRLRDSARAARRGGGAPRGLNIDDTLKIAKQIADALEAAHEQGIVHRDLKPANIKVRSDGAVKVLDFGLAKALAPSIDINAGSTTMTSPALLTSAGMVLGTAAYMSPEQAKGRAADKRSDIWAFGSVLFEMLTGRMAFSGETVTETLAAVMRDRPALETLPAASPPAVSALIARCLARDPRQRLRDIGEARITLERIIAGGDDEMTSATAGGKAAATGIPAWRRFVPWGHRRRRADRRGRRGRHLALDTNGRDAGAGIARRNGYWGRRLARHRVRRLDSAVCRRPDDGVRRPAGRRPTGAAVHQAVERVGRVSARRDLGRPRSVLLAERAVEWIFCERGLEEGVGEGRVSRDSRRGEEQPRRCVDRRRHDRVPAAQLRWGRDRPHARVRDWWDTRAAAAAERG